MTIYQKGDLWKAPKPDVYLIPTNACVQHGDLVMGAGFARQVKERFPGIERKFGINFDGVEKGLMGLVEDYYLMPVFHQAQLFLAVQTKRRWDQPASLSLIDRACDLLSAFEIGWVMGARKDAVFYFPFPGIGMGGLPRAVVKPYLDRLSDRFIIWEQ